MKEIFKILEQNARATPAQIATMVDKPVSAVKKIIKQAEKDGTILKYKTIINWPKYFFYFTDRFIRHGGNLFRSCPGILF